MCVSIESEGHTVLRSNKPWKHLHLVNTVLSLHMSRTSQTSDLEGIKHEGVNAHRLRHLSSHIHILLLADTQLIHYLQCYKSICFSKITKLALHAIHKVTFHEDPMTLTFNSTTPPTTFGCCMFLPATSNTSMTTFVGWCAITNRQMVMQTQWRQLWISSSVLLSVSIQQVYLGVEGDLHPFRLAWIQTVSQQPSQQSW